MIRLSFRYLKTLELLMRLFLLKATQTISGELNVTGGFNIGIQSGGTDIATGVVTAINFIGAGNTAVYECGLQNC